MKLKSLFLAFAIAMTPAILPFDSGEAMARDDTFFVEQLKNNRFVASINGLQAKRVKTKKNIVNFTFSAKQLADKFEIIKNDGSFSKKALKKAIFTGSGMPPGINITFSKGGKKVKFSFDRSIIVDGGEASTNLKYTADGSNGKSKIKFCFVDPASLS